MADAKHTPGPWVVEYDRPCPGWVEVVGPSFTPSAPTVATDLTQNDFSLRRADARLIAAAPDLLEALKSVENHLAIEGSHLQGVIKAAISKAEGK